MSVFDRMTRAEIASSKAAAEAIARAPRDELGWLGSAGEHLMRARRDAEQLRALLAESEADRERLRVALAQSQRDKALLEHALRLIETERRRPDDAG